MGCGHPGLALGPHEPLRHGRLGDQEGTRDLPGREPTQEPQGQGDLGACRERRMAAGEDEPEPVIVHGTLGTELVRLAHQRGASLAIGTRRLPAMTVDEPMASGRDRSSRPGWAGGRSWAIAPGRP